MEIISGEIESFLKSANSKSFLKGGINLHLDISLLPEPLPLGSAQVSTWKSSKDRQWEINTYAPHFGDAHQAGPFHGDLSVRLTDNKT